MRKTLNDAKSAQPLSGEKKVAVASAMTTSADRINAPAVFSLFSEI